MPTRAWFPTFIYSEPLRPGSAARFNVGLADECRRLRDYRSEEHTSELQSH